MIKHNKLWRRLLLLTVLLASLSVSAGSSTGAHCPYAPDDYYPSDEPNACEQRCIDQFNACMSDGISYYNCNARRSCCLYLCGA
jgi:hypothetical protein